MNGVHDLGGMHGFGPIERDENEPRFHADWEAHVAALLGAAARRGLITTDAHRYGIERMNPADYLRSSYYERWLVSMEHNLIQAGVLSRDEVDARTEAIRQDPDTPLPGPDPAAPEPPLPAATNSPMPHLTPRFAVGDAVVTRNVHPTGHTRLPRYARGKRGVIQLVHGPAVFPDTNAHGLGEQPQVVYNVRFDGRELWGESAEPRQTVAIDLWESYLEPASA